MLESREMAVTKKGVAFTLFNEGTPLGDLEKIVISLNADDIEVESQRIAAMNQLHKLKSRSAWFIGELLLKEEAILTKRYQLWLKRKEDGATGPEERYTQPRKIMHWVEANEDKLKFGTRQARRYVMIRQTTDKEVADKVGVKKLDIISNAPEIFQEDLKKKAMDLNWSAVKLTNEVARIKITLASQKEYEKKVKPNLPRISVKLDKSHPNRLILEVSAKERDALNELLQNKYIPKMKEDLFYSLTH